jgi:hypothetical protein
MSPGMVLYHLGDNLPQVVAVLDVESIGLHGEGFAVGVHVMDLCTGDVQLEWLASVPTWTAQGTAHDRAWVRDNIPDLTYGLPNAPAAHVPRGREYPSLSGLGVPMPWDLRREFRHWWEDLKVKYPDMMLAADVPYPVETNFLEACYRDVQKDMGVYPLLDVNSILLATDLTEAEKMDRNPTELPRHNPLADARQSARLLRRALKHLERD